MILALLMSCVNGKETTDSDTADSSTPEGHDSIPGDTSTPDSVDTSETADPDTAPEPWEECVSSFTDENGISYDQVLLVNKKTPSDPLCVNYVETGEGSAENKCNLKTALSMADESGKRTKICHDVGTSDISEDATVEITDNVLIRIEGVGDDEEIIFSYFTALDYGFFDFFNIDIDGDGLKPGDYTTVRLTQVDAAEDFYFSYSSSDFVEMTIDDSTIRSGISLGDNNTVTVTDSTLKGYISGSTSTDDSVDISASSIESKDSYTTPVSLGPASILRITNSQLNNSINLSTLIKSEGEVSIQTSTIQENTFDVGGRGYPLIHVYGEDSSLTISGTDILYNESLGDPYDEPSALIYTDSADVLIEESLLYENTINGYGVYIYDGTLEMNNTAIREFDILNPALYLYSSIATLTDVNIRDNSAIGLHAGYSSVDIERASFYNNQNVVGDGGDGYGGGIALYNQSTARIKNASFIHNYADEKGGGIHLDSSSQLYASFCTYINNTGGGISNAGSASRAQVMSSAFQDNLGAGTDSACIGDITSLGFNISSGECDSLTATGDATSTETELQVDAIDKYNPDTYVYSAPSCDTEGCPTRDISPCEDVFSDPVAEDANTRERPQGGLCDAGAYEALVE